MENNFLRLNEKYIFEATLNKDAINPLWSEKLTLLTAYFDKNLQGIAEMNWDFYRIKNSCFCVLDIGGNNGETVSLTLMTGDETLWPSKILENEMQANSADIQVSDMVDIFKLVIYLLEYYKMELSELKNSQLIFLQRSDYSEVV